MKIMTAYDNPEGHSGPTMRGMPAYWGGSKTANFPVGTVAIDRDGDAWQHYETSGWEPIGGCCCMHHALPDDGVPYTIVWEPKEDTGEH